MKKHGRWPVLLLACALAACGADDRAGAAPDPSSATSASPEAAPPATGGDAPQPGAPEGPGVDPLPPTRALDVHVEGQVEAREAHRFDSPQGYAIYVLPQLEMTAEEPCCDLAWARVDDGFTMRIERVDEAVPVEDLRGDMALALSAVGQAEALAPGTPGIRVPGETELLMRARGQGVTSTMFVARIDGARYRVTLHMPHREAAEGIGPSFWAMLGSLRTTGPRPDGA